MSVRTQHPNIRLSKTADGLAQKIYALLETGARPVQFFRLWSPSDAMFEQAVGRLFIKGQARFIGSGKGRRLSRAA